MSITVAVEEPHPLIVINISRGATPTTNRTLTQNGQADDNGIWGAGMAGSPAKQEKAGPRKRYFPAQNCPGHRMSWGGWEEQAGIVYFWPLLFPRCSLGGETWGTHGRGSHGAYCLWKVLRSCEGWDSTAAWAPGIKNSPDCRWVVDIPFIICHFREC